MNKYITAIPFMNALSTAENRPAYLSELKRAGAERVFICPRNSFRDNERRAEILKLLAENIEFYKSNGFEVGVWFGGFGHGGELNPTDKSEISDFTKIVGLRNGAVSNDSFCPLDPEYKTAYLGFIKAAAELHPDLIMIDDDFRLSLRRAIGIGCACEKHIREFSRRLGRDVTREELSSLVFTDEANEYRKLWLELMRDTMLDFSRELRKTVDSAMGGENIRLGHCACIPTWDTDGADSIEIAQVLAGKNRPFLRLIGAPYWNLKSGFGTVSLGEIVEIERMQLNWCRKIAPEIEVFTECDAYPRPRYVIRSSFLECFDSALTAAGGTDGILKYMLDYNTKPLYETGYVDRHVKNTPERRKIAELSENKTATGIRIIERMHKLADYTFDGIASDKYVINLFFSPAQKLCCQCSMPITYDNELTTTPVMLFGENAKEFINLPEINNSPLILDIKAAEILHAQGIDTGLIRAEKIAAPKFEYFSNERIPLSQSAGFYKIETVPEANILSGFDSDYSNAPAAYTYVNPDGQRFLVYSFDAYEVNANDALFCSYERQAQLAKAYEWLCGSRPDAYLPKNPKLHIICKKSAEQLTVFLGNFSCDEIPAPTVKLSGTYNLIEFTGKHSGTLLGDSVFFDTDIPAYSVACFSVYIN